MKNFPHSSEAWEEQAGGKVLLPAACESSLALCFKSKSFAAFISINLYFREKG
jgi:hypothetical protein